MNPVVFMLDLYSRRVTTCITSWKFVQNILFDLVKEELLPCRKCKSIIGWTVPSKHLKLHKSQDSAPPFGLIVIT